VLEIAVGIAVRRGDQHGVLMRALAVKFQGA
jgi:hypothetical protein